MQNIGIKQHWFNRRETTLLLVLFAFMVKAITGWYAFTIDGDKSAQLLAAKSLTEGQGISIPYSPPEDLSQIQYKPLTGWPPGYSLSLAPLLFITGHDYKTAALLFDLFWLLPFFLILLLLLRYAGASRRTQNFFLLFAAFFFYPFSGESATDLVAVVFLLAAFWALLRVLRGDSVSPAISTLFLFLPGLFKYQYIPVGIVMPLFLSLAGYWQNNRSLIRTGLLLFLFTVLLNAGLLFFQQLYTGSAFYLNSPQSGFFPANLQNLYPFVPAAFLDVETALSRFTSFTGTDYRQNGRVLLFTGYLLFLFLTAYALVYTWRRRKEMKSPAAYLVYLGTGISLSLIGLLFYLSLRNAGQQSPFYQPWTYIQEYRYFLFPVILLQLVYFIFFPGKFTQLPVRGKYISCIVLSLLLLNFVYSVYATGRIILSVRKPFYHSPAYTERVGFFTGYYQRVQQQYPDHRLVIASPDHALCHYAGLEGFGSLPLSHFQQTPLRFRSAEKTKVLLILDSLTTRFYTPLLRFNPGNPSDRQGNHYFYLLDAEPLTK